MSGAKRGVAREDEAEARAGARVGGVRRSGGVGRVGEFMACVCKGQRSGERGGREGRREGGEVRGVVAREAQGWS